MNELSEIRTKLLRDMDYWNGHPDYNSIIMRAIGDAFRAGRKYQKDLDVKWLEGMIKPPSLEEGIQSLKDSKIE